jgi:hypothetical protein
VNCASCGSVIVAGQKFCDTCGATVNPAETARTGPAALAGNGYGVSPPGDARYGASPPGDARYGAPPPGNASYGVPAPGDVISTLPGTPIVLGDGEVLWRQYNAVQLRTRAQGEGAMFVTDTRVVLYARAKGRGTQRPSSLVQQVKLEHVTGVTAAVSRRISLGLMIFTLLVGLATLGLLAQGNFPLAILFAAVTAFCAWRLAVGAANRGAVGVVIQAGAQGQPIVFGQTGRRGAIARLIKLLLPASLYRILGVFTAEDVLDEGVPGEDSDKLIAELGALIFDLQTRGNLADTHWGVVANGQAFDRTRG